MTRGLWRYIHAPHIADDFDEYFALNSLFDYDVEVLARRFDRPGRLVDLGCGTGRMLVAFARRGFRTLGVDLSLPMLRVVGEKARKKGVEIDRLQANLVELGCIEDDSADYCVCMFSTLGMIYGRENRRCFLRHARRIVRPGGLFALHVHNLWFNLYDPPGRAWLARHLLWETWRYASIQRGDKYYDYRGVPGMYLHVFTRAELTSDLTAAGFRVRELIPLDAPRERPLRQAWFFGRLRANGWIAVCE